MIACKMKIADHAEKKRPARTIPRMQSRAVSGDGKDRLLEILMPVRHRRAGAILVLIQWWNAL